MTYIKTLIVFFVILIILIWWYPFIIDYLICYYDKSYQHNIDAPTRGTFGDMYGMLNSFLSGLALIGLVYTLYWQKKQDEIKIINEQKDKMIYLEGLFKEGISILNNYIDSYATFSDELKLIPFNIPQNKVRYSQKRLKVITSKLDQESYYLSYKAQVKQGDIIASFRNFDSAYQKINLTIEDIQNKALRDDKRKKEFSLLLHGILLELKQRKDTIEPYCTPNDSYLTFSKYLINRYDEIDKFDSLKIFNEIIIDLKNEVFNPKKNNSKFDFEDFKALIERLENQKNIIETNNKDIILLSDSLKNTLLNFVSEINQTQNLIVSFNKESKTQTLLDKLNIFFNGVNE